MCSPTSESAYIVWRWRLEASEFVAVDHADFADAGAGQVLEDWDAEAAAADHQHAAVTEFGLTLLSPTSLRAICRE